jgi:hypothetical protein
MLVNWHRLRNKRLYLSIIIGWLARTVLWIKGSLDSICFCRKTTRKSGWSKYDLYRINKRFGQDLIIDYFACQKYKNIIDLRHRNVKTDNSKKYSR